MARPMPVLPLVASTTVCPGLSSPFFSASSMTPRASRSFTEPSGLNASILTYRFTPGGARRLILTTGVLPTVSRMLPNFAMRAPLGTKQESAVIPRCGRLPLAGDEIRVREALGVVEHGDDCRRHAEDADLRSLRHRQGRRRVLPRVLRHEHAQGL